MVPVLILKLLSLGPISVLFVCASGYPRVFSTFHPTIDPVCRMVIDSETTRFVANYGGREFFFCSEGCRARFRESPERYALLMLELETAGRASLRLDIKSPGRIVAGSPATIDFAILDRESKKRISDFEVVHQRTMHVLVVRSDLKKFYHVHPVLLPDGLFRLVHTFQDPGRYRAFFDFTPSTGLNQVMHKDLVVGGGSREKPFSIKNPELNVDFKAYPNPVRSGQEAYIVFTHRDPRGRPISSLEPFLGSNGHLIAVSQDMESFNHTHGMTALPPRGHTVFDLPAELVTNSGPTICYRVVFPKPGRYALWSQVGWRGRVITTPCSIQVLPKAPIVKSPAHPAP
jgi:YHS domain-containing protein